jgi:hypothetical protein
MSMQIDFLIAFCWLVGMQAALPFFVAGGV